MLDKNQLEEIVRSVVELLLKKNADYGNSYFELRSEFGKVAFLVRLGDKYGRLKVLAKKEPEVTGESEEDTIRDIIGYCLLELYYRKYIVKQKS